SHAATSRPPHTPPTEDSRDVAAKRDDLTRRQGSESPVRNRKRQRERPYRRLTFLRAPFRIKQCLSRPAPEHDDESRLGPPAPAPSARVPAARAGLHRQLPRRSRRVAPPAPRPVHPPARSGTAARRRTRRPTERGLTAPHRLRPRRPLLRLGLQGSRRALAG